MRTDVMTVDEAERALADAIRSGAGDEAIDRAAAMVLDARDDERRRAKAAGERQKAEGTIARARSHDRREALEAAMNAAEQRLVASDAPVVTIRANGIVVTLSLRAGRDPVARMTLRRAAALAVEEADRSFVARIGHARAQAGGDDGVVLPSRKFLVDRMRDELRHAQQACLGSVQIELTEPIEQDSTLAAAAPDSGHDSGAVGLTPTSSPAAASPINHDVGAVEDRAPSRSSATGESASPAPTLHDNDNPSGLEMENSDVR